LKTAITMRRGFHDLIAQQFSTIFSAGCYFFRTTLNKITSQRFQQHLQKAPLCGGIGFHLFIFTYSSAFAIP